MLNSDQIQESWYFASRITVLHIFSVCGTVSYISYLKVNLKISKQLCRIVAMTTDIEQAFETCYLLYVISELGKRKECIH